MNLGNFFLDRDLNAPFILKGIHNLKDLIKVYFNHYNNRYTLMLKSYEEYNDIDEYVISENDYSTIVEKIKEYNNK